MGGTTPTDSTPLKVKGSSTKKNSPRKRSGFNITPVKETKVKLPPSEIAPCRKPLKIKAKKNSSSPKSKGKKKSPKKSPKVNGKKDSSGQYQNHRVIGKMIYAALTGEVPLPNDGAGKVHLGNNVWIKESAWAKLSTSSKSLSATVQNLTECIWGWKKCAFYSVTGGVSPKNPGATPKEAAPPAGIHAILGSYRAKLMQQGLKVEEVLDDNVEKLGKSHIKEKFHNSHKKYVRELSKADEFADRNIKGEAEEKKDE